MDFKITDCADGDVDLIYSGLTESNSRKVPELRNGRYFEINKKIVGESGKVAAENSCTLAHLSTFDFQAKNFYIKHWYEVFGILENSPEGHCRYYLKKVIK